MFWDFGDTNFIESKIKDKILDTWFFPLENELAMEKNIYKTRNRKWLCLSYFHSSYTYLFYFFIKFLPDVPNAFHPTNYFYFVFYLYKSAATLVNL